MSVCLYACTGIFFDLEPFITDSMNTGMLSHEINDNTYFCFIKYCSDSDVNHSTPIRLGPWSVASQFLNNLLFSAMSNQIFYIPLFYIFDIFKRP